MRNSRFVCFFSSSFCLSHILQNCNHLLSFIVQNVVLRLHDVVENAETSNISVRSINIPGEPYVLALSCDHTMLAVCYTANRQSFMDIYLVQSFLSAVSI